MNCLDLIMMTLSVLHPDWSEAKSMRYADPICEASIKNDVDPLIAVSIIQHENSRWNHKVVYKNRNGSADYGLMQFNCPNGKIWEDFRRWWCNRKDRLLTIEGGIKAGIRELKSKRKICTRLHKDEGILNLYNLDSINLFNINLSDCRDCSLSPLVSNKYSNSKSFWRLKKVLKKHWWVQHYNWNSHRYYVKVLYVYLTLRFKVKANYDVVRKRQYTNFYKQRRLKSCLEDEQKFRRSCNGESNKIKE